MELLGEWIGLVTYDKRGKVVRCYSTGINCFSIQRQIEVGNDTQEYEKLCSNTNENEMK